MSDRRGGFLYRMLAEPATRGIPIDDPALTVRRRQLSKEKPGLYLSYRAWYRELEAVSRGAPPGPRIELGSGGGFLEERIPGLVKTDVLPLPFVHLLCRSEQLPFADGSLSALFLVNVLHHIARPDAFFREVARVLRTDGRLGMIEPYVTPFSRLVRKFHPEANDTTVATWDSEPTGPLSGGNEALPWVIFVRDRQTFERRHPDLQIVRITPHTVLTHLLSGGVMLRSLLPGFLFPGLQWVEARLGPRAMRTVGLFSTIVLRKVPPAREP